MHIRNIDHGLLFNDRKNLVILYLVKNPITSQEYKFSIFIYFKTLDFRYRYYAIWVTSIFFHFRHAIPESPAHRQSAWQHTHRGCYFVSTTINYVCVLALVYRPTSLNNPTLLFRFTRFVVIT